MLAALAGVPVPAGRVRVTSVRRGGRRMDGDNLAGGYKACRDAVACWLGCDDGDDDRAVWEYKQRPGGRQATCAIVVRPG